MEDYVNNPLALGDQPVSLGVIPSNPLALGDESITPSLSNDLSTSEGLYNLAQQVGGPVGEKATAIMEPQKTFWGSVKEHLKGGLWKVIRVLNVGANISAGVIDPNKTVGEAIRENEMPSDVLFDGITADTKLGKTGLFMGRLATDILLDPITYVTFGTGSSVFGARATTKIGEKALTKTGQKFFAKALKQGLKGGLSEDFVKTSFQNMLKANPKLAEKFIDKGGIKFFGKTILSGQRIRTAVKTIPGYKKIDQATQPIRNTLGALFNKDIDPMYGKLPREFTDLKNRALDISRVKSTSAVNKVINIARANKLTYQEAGIISNAIEQGTIIADPRLEKVRKEIVILLGRARKAEQQRGILKHFLNNYVPHILVDEPAKIPLSPTRGMLKYAKHRKISTTIKEINDVFGEDFFDPNIIRATAKRLIASERAITARDFYTSVIKKFGVSIKGGIPEGYVVPKVSLLKNYAFHPAIARQLEQVEKGLISDVATNKALRAFDKMQNIWKASVTSIFPAFHGRNAISNVFQNFLDIGANTINPAIHGNAITLLDMDRKANKLERIAFGVGKEAKTAKKELSKLLSQTVLKDRFGSKWTFGELRNLIKTNRVAFGSEFVGFMDIDASLGELAGKTLLKGEKISGAAKKALPISQEFIPFKGGRIIGNWIEEEARLVNFITNLKNTGDPLLAAKRTKQFLFDYKNLSPFEKGVLRRLIPFYTWTRKNLELQIKSLLHVPGRISTETKLLTTLGMVISGGVKLTPEQKDKLPDWIKQGISILAKKNGETLTILGSLQTPFEQPFQAFQTHQLLGSISPLIRVPLELATGYNFFYGKPLSEVTNAAGFKRAPDFIKQFIGYQEVEWTDKSGKKHIWYVSLNPERMHLLTNLPPTSRVFSALKQIENADVSQQYRLLQQMIGVRPYTFDLDIQARKIEKENRRKLEDLLQRSGVVYKFERTYYKK